MVRSSVAVTVTCGGQLPETLEEPAGETGAPLLEPEREPEPVPKPVPEPVSEADSGEDGADAKAEAEAEEEAGCRVTNCVRVEVDLMVVVGLPPPTASAGADDELLVA